MSLNNCQRCGNHSGIWRYQNGEHICNPCYTGIPDPPSIEERSATEAYRLLAGMADRIAKMSDKLDRVLALAESDISVANTPKETP